MWMSQKVIQILRTSFSRWGNRGPGRERVRVACGGTVALCGAVSGLPCRAQEFHMYRSPELLFLVSGLRKGQGWRIEAQSPEGQQGGGSPLDCV